MNTFKHEFYFRAFFCAWNVVMGAIKAFIKSLDKPKRSEKKNLH